MAHREQNAMLLSSASMYMLRKYSALSGWHVACEAYYDILYIIVIFVRDVVPGVYKLRFGRRYRG